MKKIKMQGFAQGSLEARLHGHVYMMSHTIGSRNVVHYDHLEAARSYIRGQFETLGYLPHEQLASASKDPYCYNIYAEKRGTDLAEEYVIVGAHYDSCYNPDGNPGADDNASAVAGMLELARLLKDQHSRRTILFVAFVNEEPPYFLKDSMGSAFFCRLLQARKITVHLGVILEMIGYFSDSPQDYSILDQFGPQGQTLRENFPAQADFIIGFSDQASYPLLGQVAGCYAQASSVPMVTNIGLGAVGEAMTQLCASDNLSFWAAGYRAIMVSDTAHVRNKAYHTARDTWDTLDYERMAQVVRGLEPAIVELGTKP